MRARFVDPESTPSARMLREMRERGLSFFAYGLELSRARQEEVQALGVSPEEGAAFRAQAQASRADQSELERTDDVSFETYLENYFFPPDS